MLDVRWKSFRLVEEEAEVGSGSVAAISSARVRGKASGASGSAWVTAKTEYPVYKGMKRFLNESELWGDS